MRTLLLFVMSFLACSIQAQDTVRLNVPLSSLTAVEKVYDFIVSDFENIVGFQFSMTFDDTKMQFREARNIILDHMTTNSFNDPLPGTLLSVWLDTDLEATDYSEPTPVFQLVFDVLEGEGSTLCFTNTPLDYEFIVEEVPGDFHLSHMVIDDDCQDGTAILLNTTATEDPAKTSPKIIDELYLNTHGILTFTSSSEELLRFSAFNPEGKIVATSKPIEVVKGTNEIALGQELLPGIYFINWTDSIGNTQSQKVFVK
jgi:hypothetical protein